MQKCLAFFPGADRTMAGYEGLMAAQDCLPNNDVRDAFAAEYSVLGKLWEAISPEPMLQQYEADYRWLSQVYVSVQPTSGTGRLIWHALGAKTIELIHQNVHVGAIRDDLETLVVDGDTLDIILAAPDLKKKTREVEIKLTARLRKHMKNPRFRALSERHPFAGAASRRSSQSCSSSGTPRRSAPALSVTCANAASDTAIFVLVCSLSPPVWRP
jgi:type I restriction enzyme, R subunit